MSQAWIHVFPNLRHNADDVDVVISGLGRPQENRIFMFLEIHKNKSLSGHFNDLAAMFYTL